MIHGTSPNLQACERCVLIWGIWKKNVPPPCTRFAPNSQLSAWHSLPTVPSTRLAPSTRCSTVLGSFRGQILWEMLQPLGSWHIAGTSPMLILPTAGWVSMTLGITRCRLLATQCRSRGSWQSHLLVRAVGVVLRGQILPFPQLQGGSLREAAGFCSVSCLRTSWPCRAEAGCWCHWEVPVSPCRQPWDG